MSRIFGDQDLDYSYNSNSKCACVSRSGLDVLSFFAYAFSNALLTANVLIKLELGDEREICEKISKTDKPAGLIRGVFLDVVSFLVVFG